MDFDLPTLLGGEDPTGEEQAQALLEALRQEQERVRAQRGDLSSTLNRQQGQAGGLRTLSLFSSLGDNPLLRRVQQAAGQQGAQLEGLAARTEQRLGQVDSSANPLKVFGLQLSMDRLKQAAEREKRLAGNADALQDYRGELLTLRKTGAAAAAERREQTDAQRKEQGDIKLEGSIRGEVERSPIYKSFQESKVALDKVKSAIAADSPAGDIAAIYGVMKVWDPGSTVREGEFATAQNAGGVPERIQALYNKVLSGTRLTAEQRQDFLRQAQAAHAAQAKAYKDFAEGKRKLAGSYGVNPERVAAPVDLDLNAPGAPAPKTPTPAALNGVVGPGDPRNIKEKRVLEDGTEIITYANGRVVKRTPKKKGP